MEAARNHQRGRATTGTPPYRKIRTTGGALEAQTNWREHLLDLQH